MTSPFNILILGSGGRECTLAWKIRQSPLVDQIFIAPGNAGTSDYGTNLSISESDFASIKRAVLGNQVRMVVVGPEAPLVQGIADFFMEDEQLKDVWVIGPGKTGAMLEGSKDFAKAFMNRHHIPTAAHQTFRPEEITEALSFIRQTKPPYVLKADGLAAGKGVIICQNPAEAESEIQDILGGNKFGEAGKKLVIEEFLDGIELSVFVLTDGHHFLLLPEAKDYKRIGDNDSGPNTGGMGSVSPLPFFTGDFKEAVVEKIIRPTIQGLIHDNIDYQGFIFFGLMKVGSQPYVIEYNARLGDPETEVVLPRLQNDLVELMRAAATHTLDTQEVRISPLHSGCIMMVAPGYPGSYPKGLIINNLDQTKEVTVFHAGTKQDQNHKVVSTGGRILGVTALADHLPEAVERAYLACRTIEYQDKYYRSDIGRDIIQLTK